MVVGVFTFIGVCIICVIAGTYRSELSSDDACRQTSAPARARFVRVATGPIRRAATIAVSHSRLSVLNHDAIVAGRRLPCTL